MITIPRQALVIGAALTVGMSAVLTGCGSPDGSPFDAESAITVVSREDGSGTRTAFIELFGIEEADADGNKKDLTTKEAVIAKQTDVMMTNVAQDSYAIGYVSLGSMNETVKGLKIDGVEASSENVKSGSYQISRPFNVVTKGAPADLAKDFIDFIVSAEGQAVVGADYIPVVDGAAAFAGAKPAGKIVVAGSSSVTPVMEKLKEAYLKVNTGATVEIQQSDSSAGMTAAMDGTADIGMAIRDLKDTEAAELTPVTIAMDGIVVVVSNNNPLTDLGKDKVKEVFTGTLAKWGELLPASN
jgi:phosphate transport system substrate-binding protein